MRKLDNRGGTMVEIVVGFALILIIIASFLSIIKLSSSMTNDAVDYRNKLELLQDEYYGGVNSALNTNAGANKFLITLEAGEDKEETTEKKIQLIECEPNGSPKIGPATFDLDHAALYSIDIVDDELFNTTIFRMQYIYPDQEESTDNSTQDPITENAGG